MQIPISGTSTVCRELVYKGVQPQFMGIFQGGIIENGAFFNRKGYMRALLFEVPDQEIIKNNFPAIVAQVYDTRTERGYVIRIVNGEPFCKFPLEKNRKIFFNGMSFHAIIKGIADY